MPECYPECRNLRIAHDEFGLDPLALLGKTLVEDSPEGLCHAHVEVLKHLYDPSIDIGVPPSLRCCDHSGSTPFPNSWTLVHWLIRKVQAAG